MPERCRWAGGVGVIVMVIVRMVEMEDDGYCADPVPCRIT